MDRRQFSAGAAAVTVAGLAGCRREAATHQKPAPLEAAPPSIFADDERAALRAALDRLLPAVDGSPSAEVAGVLNYLEGQLRQPHFQAFVERIRSGARALHGGARKRYKTRWFQDLPTDRQDALLQAFQTGSITLSRFDTARFFATLWAFALEGYLGDPRHGGNVDGVTWKWLGIEPARCG